MCATTKPKSVRVLTETLTAGTPSTSSAASEPTDEGDDQDIVGEGHDQDIVGDKHDELRSGCGEHGEVNEGDRSVNTS